MDAGIVDQMHVVNARRTSGHAGEAGEAAVDMFDGLGGGWLALLQHVLDQIDAAPGAIEFIAEQDIGGAGGGAEAAMHAFPQDAVRLGDARVLQLLWRERGSAS